MGNQEGGSGLFKQKLFIQTFTTFCLIFEKYKLLGGRKDEGEKEGRGA